MGLRRYVKKGERETFFIVFVVLAGLAGYLCLPKAERAAAPPPALSVSTGGMEKLWLEASLAKGDMRPLPDAEWAKEEPEAVAPPAAPAPAPEAVAADPEPEPSFPKPRPVAPEPAERPRIAPMSESLLHGSHASNTSSAFLALPARPSPATARPSPPPTAPAAPAAPPKRRTFRPLTGN